MSNLSDFITAVADRPSLDKGRNILFNSGSVYRIIYDEAKGEAYYRVRGLDSQRWYEVRLAGMLEGQTVRGKCTCTDYVPLCQHQVAALLHLDMDKNGPVETNEIDRQSVVGAAGESELSMHKIELTTVMLNTATAEWPIAKMLASDGRVRINHAADYQVRAVIEYKGESQRVSLEKQPGGKFMCTCTCADRLHRICLHKAATFLSILQERGEYYFDYLRNWDVEKNELLREFGFSLEDNMDDKFEFGFAKGTVHLKLLDKGLRKLPEFDSFFDLQPGKSRSAEVEDIMAIDGRLVNVRSGEHRLGFVWQFFSDLPYPGFSLGLFSAKFDGSSLLPNSHFLQHDFGLKHPSRTGMTLDYIQLQAAQAFHEDTFRHLFYARSSSSIVTEDLKNGIDDYLQRKLPDLFLQFSEETDMYFSTEGPLGLKGLKRMRVAPERVKVVLELSVEGKLAVFQPRYYVDSVELPKEFCSLLGKFILRCGETLYLFEQLDDARYLQAFNENGAISLHTDGLPAFIEKVIPAYRAFFKVTLPPQYELPTRYVPLTRAIYLQEQEPYLFIKPIFEYGPLQVEYDGRPEMMTLEHGKAVVVLRDPTQEEQFYNNLRQAHPSFSFGQSASFFHIHSKELLRDRWFIHFLQRMQEEGVVVYGYQALRKFRYSTAKPVTKLSVSSGLDWFDVQLELSFGDQTVSLAEIRKAILNKRDYVELSDGTLGVLPEEWLEKYGLLLKVSEKKGDGLKVSKFHFSLIEELYDAIDDDGQLAELRARQDRIKEFSHVKKMPIPKEIKGELRPYQQEGFNWLHFLHEFSWGGILADDMGLGKTLQALTFLQSLQAEKADRRFLVICPMSLIFNWENEIKKFTEGISYYIHHGPARKKSKTQLMEPGIVLTSYGTVRSDIELFKQIEYDYVILDESQAIKNPLSLSSKAVQLLKTRQRLCLSGTPLQNNTFDLYTQLHFCNPGMLGSLEFFREHFSNPIDRNNDPDALLQLRKLTAPFVLRRVKEEVAKELPEKIESILFCEMESEQRRIYDDVKHQIRGQLLAQIDSQGMERSGIFILQGLTRLRQICDSPAILNDEEAYPNHSVKLEELVREIKENVSNHKALVFSQFLGMLDLIRRRLDENNIEYAYFDGSTSITARQEAIERFQNDPVCRIFLISLKAGGVGLNLTAADYVYVVDPWWNPAVEQQAIDRTHRIGQEKTIFAYRMICKDTVEEKIMELQTRKRELAANLVGNETAFISKLTREDIVFLLT